MTTGQNKVGLTGWCAATVLVSAFLLFQVQPMVSKMILPWFGGGPAVWTTCMLFFQVFLLAGYLYAHLLDRLPNSRWQGLVHAVLLVAALCVLPIMPDATWKPVDSSQPQWRILKLLAANVGLPYFLLASSAPLLQAWYSRATGGRVPYRFYALSNFGSLAALLTYPFVIEPTFDVPHQSTLWSCGFGAFTVLAGGLALMMARWNVPAPHLVATAETAKPQPLSRGRLLLWVVLPAFGSMSLLAVTNQICQDVAVVPFFWVVPLSLYLLTFIICFDSEWWYRRNLFALATLVVAAMIGGVLLQDEIQPSLSWLGMARPIPDFIDSLTLEVTLYLSALFGVCMLCHGELVLSKPGPRHLTLFYLMISAGGALGGLLVALVCPKIFTEYYESDLFLVGGALLALTVILHSWWRREQRWGLWWRCLLSFPVLIARDLTRSLLRRNLEGDPRRQKRIHVVHQVIVRGRRWTTWWSILIPVPLVLAGALFAYFAGRYQPTSSVASRRSFYGVLRVLQLGTDTANERRNLYNGRILHGTQFMRADRRREATTYYNPDSGIGLTLRCLTGDAPLRVATVGLGTGTIAAYSQEGDFFCFYEINQDVIDIARSEFFFLSESPAHPQVVLGDARLSMEQQSPQNYDVIALDAFSGDAIPAHLLTVEAFAVYLQHLNKDGVLAVHTSNRHLELRPIVALLAGFYQMHVVLIDADDQGGVADSSSEWLLVTNNEEFLRTDEVLESATTVTYPGADIRIWTDQFSNLFQILKAWHDYPTVVDLDADDSSHSIDGDFGTAYVSGELPVFVADSDAALRYPPDTELHWLSLKINNLKDAPDELLRADTKGTAITARYDGETGTLLLTGVDSVPHYLQVLRSVQYENVASSPNLNQRAIEVIASDGFSESPVVMSRITIALPRATAPPAENKPVSRT